MDSPAVARALVEPLIKGGMRDMVLAPGSRSAPLALALADAERRGLIRLHVRIDERSAAYLALGLAKVSDRPVAVVTTSGTAAVNLHPAVVEAAYSGIPLVAVTADRPGEMRGTGANQTIDQRDLFGVDAQTWDTEGLDGAGMRSAVADVLATAVGEHPGPVHLNIPFTEPLVSPGSHAVGDVVAYAMPVPPSPTREDLAAVAPGADLARGLLIVGDVPEAQARADAAQLAAALGWPIISEPSGNLSATAQSLRHGPLILEEVDLVPEIVVSVGRVGLHRSVMGLLRRVPVHIAVDVPPLRGRVDPARTATTILAAVPTATGATPDPRWLARWRDADDRAAAVVDRALAEAPLSGPFVARALVDRAGADDLIVVGASWPVRHLSAYGGALEATCIGNRGTSGIDGVVSTAWGAALAHADTHPAGATYALLGDLTALYDRNGLLAPAQEPRPRLDYVVIDNDGGGIFSSLEQGAPDFARDFDRVFGTPHGGDLRALLDAPGIEVLAAATVDELRSLLDQQASGVRVIIARGTSRAAEAALLRSLQAEVDSALA